MESLPDDALQHIFSLLPLRQISISRCVSKHLLRLLTSPSFLSLSSSLSPLHFITLRRHVSSSGLHLFDLSLRRWLLLPFDFLLPFLSPLPVAASHGLLYLWAHSPAATSSSSSSKSLLLCNPLTRRFRVLPQLGSAWSRHGSVLADSAGHVIVLTDLAALYFSSASSDSSAAASPPRWLKFSSNLPSKPRSPIMAAESVFALCDVGSPWRSQWKLYACSLADLTRSRPWTHLERPAWGDDFDVLKRPRLVKGNGNTILMVGGLKSSLTSMNSACSAIVILRLDLERWEWDEAGRMPEEMYECFQECSKFKVFGGGERVCFAAKRLGKIALWDDSCEGRAEWSWIEGVPGGTEGLCRGLVFEARLTPLP